MAKGYPEHVQYRLKDYISLPDSGLMATQHLNKSFQSCS